MAKQRRKSGKLPPFVAMTWELLNSKAFKDLPFSAGKLLPYFLGKAKKNLTKPEYYEIEFELTYREAKNYGFAPKTFSRCLTEFIAKGFLDPVRKGGLRGDGKTASRFRISERWQDYGKENFKQTNWKQFIHERPF